MSAAEDYSRDPRQDRPISGLFADLARETGNLARKEIELAKAEMGEKAGAAANGIVMITVGALIALSGLLALLAAAILALATRFEPWLAALIVGGVALVIGLVMAMAGKRHLSARNLRPRRTMDSLREDKQWARSQLSR